MTVAYSAYSKKSKPFTMGADDLEGNQKAKVSKIRTVIDRWAFCITGTDNPIICIDDMSKEASEKEIREGWPDINEVVSDLAKWTKNYTENQVKKFADEEANKKLFENAKENGCTVIIFDAQEFELFRCEMKDLYPPDSFDPDSVKPIQLEEDVLHLHAMAKNRTAPKNKIPIPLNFFPSTKDALEDLIELDKQFHDLARATQANVPHIGDLGSYCHTENGQPKYVE